MASSKSSQTTKNVVMALLALWSIISLIIIVVWATSSTTKPSGQCREELQSVREKMEGARVVWSQDRKAMEEQLQASWDNHTRLQEEIGVLMESLNKTNVSLSECHQRNAVLRENITALENETELYKLREANLTAEILAKEDLIEALQHNLTQMRHQMDSAQALHDAAVSQQRAAEVQTKACEGNKQFLEKQVSRCKQKEPEKGSSSSTKTCEPSAASQTSAPTLFVLLCLGLHRTLCWRLLDKRAFGTYSN